jgi:hypothetical protein
VSFGFLGTWSTELRWAFTTRIALLLFVVPMLVTFGRPYRWPGRYCPRGPAPG